MGGLDAPVEALEGVEEVQIVRVMVRFIDKYAYSHFATSVRILNAGTLRPVPDDTVSVTFTGVQDIPIEVSHWFHLGIPLANAIIGKRVYYDFTEGEFQEGETGLDPRALPGRYIELTSKCILPNEGKLSGQGP